MATAITAPGLHYDMSAEDYFADPCPTPSLTQSIAKVLLERSPAHARQHHPRLGEPVLPEDEEREKYDAAKAIGDAAHALLIGRGKTIAEGAFNSWQTKPAKEFREEQSGSGRVVILSKHLARAMEIVEAARRQMDDAGCRDAFRVGQGEVVLAWEEGGFWYRSMIDWMVSPVLLYDLKSTGLSVAPRALSIRAAEAGWDIQAAMQDRGLAVLDPRHAGRRRFRFIAIENEPPFALVPVELPESWLTMGRKKLAIADRIWRQCMTTNTWPAYGPDLLRPEYPAWLENRWLEREASDFAAAEAPARSPRGDTLTTLYGG